MKENSTPKNKSDSENEHDDEEDEMTWVRNTHVSLLDQHTELKKMAEGEFFEIFIKKSYYTSIFLS